MKWQVTKTKEDGLLVSHPEINNGIAFNARALERHRGRVAIKQARIDADKAQADERAESLKKAKIQIDAEMSRLDEGMKLLEKK